MADEPAGRTSLGVLREILNNLGDSNQYHYLVDALEALKDLLGEGGIGEAVSEWLAAHPEATTTVQNGSITLLKLANDVKSAINGKAESSDLQTLADNLEALAQTVAEKADASDLDDKADIDGYYSQLTAGLAENLIGRGDAVPAEYLYRTAGGTADIEDGIATIDCIKGNTLVWNQLCNWFRATQTVSGITFTNNGDGSVTLSGTATEDAYLTAEPQVVNGHKYMFRGCPQGGGESTYYGYLTMRGFQPAVLDTGSGNFGTASQDGDARQVIYVKSGTTCNSVTFWPQLFDLTLMFGAGNEPATVEEFEAMFPLPYYPYSVPKMLPVDIRGIETVGFNLWDEEWEVGAIVNATGQNTSADNRIRSKNYIPCLPNTAYYCKGNFANGLFFYDANKQYLSGQNQYPLNSVITTPSNARYMRFCCAIAYGTTYQNDICINLSWSGYRNGEYEEHWSAERPIDTSRFFPTGMKKAGDKADALYADHYDTVIGSVDLGTKTWVDFSSSGNPNTFRISALELLPKAGGFSNIYCAEYSNGDNGATLENMQICGAASSANIYIRNSSCNTTAEMKAALSGVILYYELATPTTTEIDPPLNLSYKVSDFGTERIMVDETMDAPQSAPVPMEVEYGINAIDTIRRLPKEYQSHKSMGQLTAALESSLGVDITETWDEDDQRYEYEISDFELADDAVTPQSLSDEVTHGQYPSLSVGRADALTGADSTAQWATRESTGSGAATVRNVQGATVAFMQWAKSISATNWGINYTVSGSTLTFDGEIATITYDRESQSQAMEWVLGLASKPNYEVPITTGHKFLIAFDYKPSQANNIVTLGVNQAQTQFATNGTPDEWNHYANIVQQSDTAASVISFRFAAGYRNITIAAGLTIQYKNPQVFDLTTMLGSGNEPSTVAEFEAMYPLPYYPYSAPTLKPVRIAGIASTDAQGGELDAIEWTTFTLRGAGAVGDMLYSDHVETRMGVVDLGTLNWAKNVEAQFFATLPVQAQAFTTNNICVPYETSARGAYDGNVDKSITVTRTNVWIRDSAYSSGAALKAALSGVILYYALETYVSTPISPALHMTYKVERGGTEAIVVPDGEVSAAPVLTIAEGESAADVVMDALACIATPDGPVATSNHAANTYLTMQGKLYKVTTAIAAGETIAAGTNVTQTTVMDELIALTA